MRTAAPAAIFLLLALSGCTGDLTELGVRAAFHCCTPNPEPTTVAVFGRSQYGDKRHAFDGTLVLEIRRNCDQAAAGGTLLHRSEHNLTKDDFTKSDHGREFRLELDRALNDRQGTYLVVANATLADDRILHGGLSYTHGAEGPPCTA